MWLVRYLKSKTLKNDYGAPIRNFGKVSGKEIYRGAEPDKAGYEFLASVLRVATVIDLIDGDRSEAREIARRAGIRTFIHLPLSDEASPTHHDVVTFLARVCNRRLLPAYVHCKGGRHRTGGMCAAVRVEVQGWTCEEAYKEAVRYGFYSALGHRPWRDFIFSLEPASHADKGVE
jgi:protein tyrosine/serine phosphatase